MRAAAALRASLARIGAVAWKEFVQLRRDRPTLAMIVGIPALQLLLFGYAIELDVRRVAAAVLDRSGSSLSRKLTGELAATQTFRFVRRVASEAEGLDLLARSEVGAVVILPADLDRRIARGQGVEIAILADATHPTVAAAVAAAGEGLGARLGARFRPLVGGGAGAGRRLPGDRIRPGPEPDRVRPESVRVAVVPLYNPERRTPVFIVPGLVGVILTMTMMLMTALALVRERERGSFEFLIATPVRRSELMVGKIAPYLLVGHLQIALILALGVYVFDVPLQGSVLDLAPGGAVFIAGMLAVGLVISSAARTQFQAVQMAFFFFLPSMLLSGFMFPFESMPRPAQWLGEVLPLTHFLRIARGVILKGATAASLLEETAALAAFALAAFTLAALAFRKRLGD